VGLDKIEGYCVLDEKAKIQLHNRLNRYRLIAPGDAINELKDHPSEVVILDVRTDQEWNEGHIEGAQHIELNGLSQHLQKLTTNKTIGTVCGKGSRASTAASILKKNGFQDVFNIDGGMKEWKKAQLPIVRDDN